jgi:hypothetical protein
LEADPFALGQHLQLLHNGAAMKHAQVTFSRLNDASLFSLHFISYKKQRVPVFTHKMLQEIRRRSAEMNTNLGKI